MLPKSNPTTNADPVQNTGSCHRTRTRWKAKSKVSTEPLIQSCSLANWTAIFSTIGETVIAARLKNAPHNADRHRLFSFHVIPHHNYVPRPLALAICLGPSAFQESACCRCSEQKTGEGASDLPRPLRCPFGAVGEANMAAQPPIFKLLMAEE